MKRETETAAAERDAELKAIDQELRRAQDLPTQDVVETDSAYAVKLQKRAIAETRELQAAIQANSDLLLVGQINDPATLERLFTNALESNNPTRVAQVALAIEHKLGAMAIAEAKNTPHGANRPAGDAALRDQRATRRHGGTPPRNVRPQRNAVPKRNRP